MNIISYLFFSCIFCLTATHSFRHDLLEDSDFMRLFPLLASSNQDSRSADVRVAIAPVLLRGFIEHALNPQLTEEEDEQSDSEEAGGSKNENGLILAIFVKWMTKMVRYCVIDAVEAENRIRKKESGTIEV